MTVLHLIGTSEFAGTEQMVINICLGQMQHGHRVFVCTRPRARVREFLIDRGVDVIEPTIGKVSAPIPIAKFCRDNNVDVLHAHLTSGTHVANAVSLLTNIPPVGHLHVYSPDLAHKVAAKRGKLIAVSDHTKRYYVDEVGVAESRIATIPNGSDVLSDPDAKLSRDTTRRVIAEELGLPESARFVLLTARITPQKGQDLLIESAHRLRHDFPNVHYLIVGAAEDREYAESVKKLVTDRDLQSHVHFLGFRRDIVKLLRAATVAAIPSRFDPFPLAALEPFLLGTPIVAARVGGLPELIPTADLGTLVESDNPDSLADGLRSMLGNDVLRDQIGQNAQSHALERYSIGAMVRKIDDVYAEITGPKSRRQPSFAEHRD